MDTAMTEEPNPAPPPPAPPTPPQAPVRRLTRSRDDRVVGGIAGGIAHTYGWDPGLVRIVIAVAAVVTAGAVAVGYGIAWLVVPEENSGITGADLLREQSNRRTRESWALPVGVVLVAVGMLSVANRFEWGPFSELFWPITLISGGLAILLVRHRDPAHASNAPATPASTSTSTRTADVTYGEDVDPDTDAYATQRGHDAHSVHDDATAQHATSAYPAQAPWPTGVAETPLAAPPRERSMLGRLTWSTLLLLAGGAWLIDTTTGFDIDPGFVLAIGLTIVGVALVVGTWFGRSRGLIALAIVLGGACTLASALDVPLRGGIGEQVNRVHTLADVRDTYELAIGHLVVDVHEITSPDRPVHIAARDSIGQLEVVVPDDADVQVRTRVGAGDARVLGEPDANGWRVDQRLHHRGSGTRFVIDARVGFGQIVIRAAHPGTEIPVTPTTLSSPEVTP